MDVSAEREDGVSASEVTLSEKHDSQTRDKSQVKQKRPPDKHVPSCVSMKSDWSKAEPIEFQDGDHSDNQIQVKQERPDSLGPNCLSLRSGQSILETLQVSDVLSGKINQVNQERPDPPGPTCVSVKRISQVEQKSPPDKRVPSCVLMKSGRSMSEPIEFQDGDHSDNQIPVKQKTPPDKHFLKCLLMKSSRSMSKPIEFQDSRGHRKRSKVLSSRPAQKHQKNLDSIFMVLEENIVTFVKNELKKFKKVLESSEHSEGLNEDDEVMESEEEEQRRSNREVFMKLTLNFLRNMKQEQLADYLQSKTLAAICQHLDVFDLRKFFASEEGFLKLLPVVKASKTALLSGCNLSSKSAEALASVLISKNSLRELDLSNNDLQDTGVKALSYGLRSLHCKLESLCLSGCLVTEKGCADLASALKSNPSHLRELDLSFNHPGDSGVTLLRNGLDDPQWKLETLKIDHGGKRRLNSSPLRYICKLLLDPNTAHRNLSVSDDNRRVMVVKENQPTGVPKLVVLKTIR
ncbi:hypothetical protein PFLUV_G00036130 [Perca fluviatilis]|uniref:SPRY-associated domain-containing protein n=1 Tax=Perca fluviatilis TaxID=8168 RepID=A0A6A5FKX2_PERFL|nr:hypothetical protein PFLUV_G00036130 [Perca fluviatilis]